MRAVVLLLTVAVGVGLAVCPADAKRGTNRVKKRLNMPRGWTWPPSPLMKRAGQECLRELDRRGIKWKKASATLKIATPIYVPNLEFGGVHFKPIWRKGPFVMDCHLALAFAREAQSLRALGIETLRFTTIFKYRNVRRKGKKRRMLSRHALGLAVDVYEFVKTDGTKLIVKQHYKRSTLLRDTEKYVRACGSFRGLLTPGNDPRSHHDHFHFEAAMKLK